MIKSLSIQNFQGHKDSFMSFSTGINIISGASDQGKSSAIRALMWVLENKPDGYTFRSRFAKPKDKTICSIELDDGNVITRLRSKSDNYYQLNDGKPYTALNRSVPDDIKELLNLREHNTQSQFQNFFLLQDTAGDVAKKFNEVSNISIIDDILKESNSRVKKTNSNISYVKEDLKEKEEELKKYKSLDEFNEEVQKLDKLQEEIEELEKNTLQIEFTMDAIESINSQLKNYEYLDNFITDYNKLANIINNIDSILSYLNPIKNSYDSIKNIESKIETYNPEVEKEFNSLMELYKKSQILENDIEDIEADNKHLVLAVSALREIKNSLKVYQDIGILESVVKRLENKQKRYDKMSQQNNDLIELTNELYHINSDIGLNQQAVDDLTKELNKIMSNIETCPLCGTELKGE